MNFQLAGFTDLSLNDQMRLLQSTWAELLTLTTAFRSLEQLTNRGGDIDTDIVSEDSNNSSLKLRYATDYWLDERLARDCCSMSVCSSSSSNSSVQGTSTTTTSSSTSGTVVVVTPSVLDIYNLVSIIEIIYYKLHYYLLIIII